MDKKNVVALGGDGVGPEVVGATCTVLKEAGFALEITNPPHGAKAVKEFGNGFPDETKKICEKADAILFGADGGPEYASTAILPFVRWELDNYFAIRPVKYYEGTRSPIKNPNGIDFVVIREMSEGLYPGQEGDIPYLVSKMPEYKGPYGRPITSYGDGKFALRFVSERGIKRLAKQACEYTMQRKKDGFPGKLTCVSKSNILKQSDGLFQRLIEEEVKKWPEIQYDHYYVDDMARRLIRYPQDFDVIVTSNLFGDILSDEAAELTGGLGLAGTGCYGGRVPYFEPTHGSAPKYTGKNVVNPTGAMLSAKLMLEYLDMRAEAKALHDAIIAVYKEGATLTYDQGGKASTTEFATAVLKKIK